MFAVAPTKVAFTTSRPAVSRRARMVRVAAEGQINPSIQKDLEKVVDTVGTGAIEKQAVFCRCWKSAKFPYCDGGHNKHNKETGDNVGPLIIKKE